MLLSSPSTFRLGPEQSVEGAGDVAYEGLEGIRRSRSSLRSKGTFRLVLIEGEEGSEKVFFNFFLHWSFHSSVALSRPPKCRTE